jgi:hypothetical protein
MALRRDKLFALKYGEGPQKSGAAYVGGSPLMTGATGFDVADAPANVIGISANCAAYDLKYNGKVTYYFMPCILTLNNGDQGVYGMPEIADDYAYDTTLAWVIGDKVYWNGTSKKWQRTAATGGDPAFGIVLEVGADKTYLVIQFERI